MIRIPAIDPANLSSLYLFHFLAPKNGRHLSMHPLGQTRTTVTANHAVIATDSYVTSPMFGWSNVEGVMLISPAMASASAASSTRGPGFAMYLASITPQSQSAPIDDDIQRCLYVLEGEISIDGHSLAPESFAYLPPGDTFTLTCDVSARLLVFEKRYVDLDGVQPPGRIVGQLSDQSADPFMGDPSARLAKLLPDTAAFDMAVNVFTFDPGTPLPLVETHIMEHGLYMSAGAGVYRLDDCWYPVKKSDSIWMAAYCPQWFVAMGKQPAQYVYYKDVNRNHLPSSSSTGR